MAPATADFAPTYLTSYLDMMAVALDAAATWWRAELADRDARGCFGPALTEEQLEVFQRELGLCMTKLLLRNALERGLSWREWAVQTAKQPDEVLRAAATTANIGAHVFPFHTRMWLRLTNDQVQVHVRCGFRGDERAPEKQVWPLTS
jgi:hypothetical protein